YHRRARRKRRRATNREICERRRKAVSVPDLLDAILQFFEAVEGLGSGRRKRDLPAQGGEGEDGSVGNVGSGGGGKVGVLPQHQGGGGREPRESQGARGTGDGEERRRVGSSNPDAAVGRRNEHSIAVGAGSHGLPEQGGSAIGNPGRT